MDKAEIRSRIKGIIDEMRPAWKEYTICDSDNLRNDIGLESIDFLDLLLQTEILFNIKITPEEASKAVLVSDFIELVEQKLK